MVYVFGELREREKVRESGCWCGRFGEWKGREGKRERKKRGKKMGSSSGGERKEMKKEKKG